MKLALAWLAVIVSVITCLFTTRLDASSCTFMIYCDSRGGWHPEQINAQIVGELAAETAAISPDFVMIPGDLVSYGSREAFEVWRAAMKPVYDAGIAVYPIIGNHDETDVEDFIDLFGPVIPDNGPAGQVDRTYFVRHNNVLAIALDQFVGPNYFDEAWLKEVLATNTAPHVFVAGHIPAFKVQHDDTLDDSPIQRDALWQILERAGSRAYFCGHDHFYDHMRLDDGDGNQNNDVHQYIVGTAGAPLYPDGPYDGDNGRWTPQRVLHEENFGYVVVSTDDLNATITWYHRTEEGSYESSDDAFTYVAQPRPELKLSVADGTASLTFIAREGIRYVVEKSADLDDWHPVLTNITPGKVTCDVSIAGTSCQMFRVRQ